MLMAHYVSAQSPALLNTDWQITKIVREFGPESYPPPMPYPQKTTFSTTNPQLYSSFFNVVSANLNYVGADRFTVSNKTCTLADYWGDNGQVNEFFGKLCNFFSNSSTFFYYIQSTGAEKTLMIHNSIFEEIHFKSVNLSAVNSITNNSFGPNPVKNTLTVDSSGEIKTFQLFDSTGKLVLEEKSVRSKTLKIQMQNLRAGLYFLKINDDPPFKISKE